MTDPFAGRAHWADLPAIAAARVGSVRAQLGEGPSWDAARGVVWWVDIRGRQLHATSLDGRDRAMDVARPLGCVVLRASGGLAAFTPRGFEALDPDTGALTTLVAVEADDPRTRANDGKVNPAGRFWAGTMDDQERPDGGSLYRLDADLRVSRMLHPVSISNGLDWTDDGRTMLYIDTSTQRVDRIEYDAATGDLGQRRPWVTIPEGAGHPDGMTLDAEGCAWVALWGAAWWCASRPTGSRSRVSTCRGERQQLCLRGTRAGPAHHHDRPVARPDDRAAGCRRSLCRAAGCPGEAGDRFRGLTSAG